MIIGKNAEGLSARLAADVEDIRGEAEGGLGDDDEFEDAEAGSDDKLYGWAAEHDIEIPQDMEATPLKEDPGEGQDDGYFVAPVRGVPPIQHCTETERLCVGSFCLFFLK